MAIARTSRFQTWYRGESGSVIVPKPSTLSDPEFADRVYTIYWYTEAALNGGAPTMTWVGTTNTIDNTVTFTASPADVNRIGVLHYQVWRHLLSDPNDKRAVGAGTTEFKDGLAP